MASRQQEFANEVYSAARRAGLNDVQARVAASQASLETGYGKSVKGNNYFGIKASPSWKGGTQRFQTWEVEDGRRVNQQATFRSYRSPEESLRDWADLMSRNYPGVMSANSFPEAVQGLTQGRYGSYATDPQYTDKLGYINRNFVNPQPGMYQNMMQQPAPNTPLTNVAGQAPGTLYQAVDAMPSVPANVPTPGTMYGPVSPLQAAPVTPVQRGVLGMPAPSPGLLNVPTPTPRPNPGMVPTPTPSPGIPQTPGIAVQQPQVAQRIGLQPQTPLGATIRGGMGSIAGGVLGGFLGPIGGLLGAYLGSQMMQGKNPLSTVANAFQRTNAVNQFPSAPRQKSRGSGELTEFGQRAARGEVGGRNSQAGRAARGEISGLF